MVVSGDLGETQDSHETGTLFNGDGKRWKQGCWRQAKLEERSLEVW